MSNNKLVETGTWKWGNEGVGWKLYSSSLLPNPANTTAVFCVAITDDRKIILEREERGWGMLGGHIDEGESLENALSRECQEEGGFTPTEPILFAYRKIIAHKPVTHPQPGKNYPFPISYIAYYWAVTDMPLVPHTEPEVLEVKALAMDDIKELDTKDMAVITLGWNAYLQSQL